MQFNVSQSKVNAWRLCRLKYHLQHHEHLKPKVKARPLKFGSMVHRLMEADTAGEDPYQLLDRLAEHDHKLFKEEEEYYGAIVADVRYIFRAYQKFWAKEPLKFIPVNKRKAEHNFEIDLTSNIKVKGRIDGLVKFRGFNALLENKSHKKFPNDDHRWRNIQSAVYLRIIDMLGWGSYHGTLWNYVRSKPPTRPQILKDGTISKKSIDTLPEVVLDTLKQNNIRPNKAAAELVQLQETNLQTWFQRVYTPIQPAVVRTLFREFIDTSREMMHWYDHHSDERPGRSIGQHCQWCPYEPLCRAELQGNDVDFVREHEFVIDESEYQTEGEYDADED